MPVCHLGSVDEPRTLGSDNISEAIAKQPIPLYVKNAAKKATIVITHAFQQTSVVKPFYLVFLSIAITLFSRLS